MNQAVDELAKRFEGGVADLDELVAALEAAGINDRAAQRYGVPDVFALGEAVLARLRHAPTHTPGPAPFLSSALRRSALLLTPVLVAVAASDQLDQLDRVGWALPAGAVALGWAAARGLNRVGTAITAAAGCVPVWFLATDRPLAYGVGFTGFALAAGTGARLRWAVPAWLAAAALLTGVWDRAEVLPAAAGILLIGGLVHRRPLNPWAATTALLQAAAMALVWRAAPSLAVQVLGVPALVVLVRWYAARAATAADAHDDVRAFRREVHDLATATVGALLPPLVAGVALGTAAYRLPFQLSTHPGARALVLGLAAGLLLAGVLALTALLVARGRPVVAAAVAAGAVAAAGASLPAAVAGLAVTYLAGLVLTAHAVFDPDRY